MESLSAHFISHRLVEIRIGERPHRGNCTSWGHVLSFERIVLQSRRNHRRPPGGCLGLASRNSMHHQYDFSTLCFRTPQKSRDSLEGQTTRGQRNFSSHCTGKDPPDKKLLPRKFTPGSAEVWDGAFSIGSLRQGGGSMGGGDVPHEVRTSSPLLPKTP